MKICEAPMKELYLGRKVLFGPLMREAVIVGLHMERPPTITGRECPNPTEEDRKQTGPRYSTVDILILYSKRLVEGIYIETTDLIWLENEEYTTADLYNKFRK